MKNEIFSINKFTILTLYLEPKIQYFIGKLRHKFVLSSAIDYQYISFKISHKKQCLTITYFGDDILWVKHKNEVQGNISNTQTELEMYLNQEKSKYL